jgi:hypothetical protein
LLLGRRSARFASGAAFLFETFEKAPFFRPFGLEAGRVGFFDVFPASAGRALIFLTFFLESSRKKFYNSERRARTRRVFDKCCEYRKRKFKA